MLQHFHPSEIRQGAADGESGGDACAEEAWFPEPTICIGEQWQAQAEDPVAVVSPGGPAGTAPAASAGLLHYVGGPGRGEEGSVAVVQQSLGG